MQQHRLIQSYTFEEYVERVKLFHGYAAPGVIIGGFMVDFAYQHLPEKGLFDALCETSKCLPDAIQLLTPCTVGNGWLTIVDIGRFALCLYDKQTGEGIRVFVDPARIRKWTEIRDWFFRLKSKKEQNNEMLIRQIKEAGTGICGSQVVNVPDHMRRKKFRSRSVLCPNCGEAYPTDGAPVCSGCRNPLYVIRSSRESEP